MQMNNITTIVEDSVKEDPITSLLDDHLAESTRKLERLNDVEKKRNSVNPSQYLSELKLKLERNLKQKDQSLECPIGSASKLKEVILAGVQTQDEFERYINNNGPKLVENEEVIDCLQNKLNDFKLKMEEDKKYLELIEKLLK